MSQPTSIRRRIRLEFRARATSALAGFGTVLLSLISAPAQDRLPIEGVLGNDDREIVESLEPPWNAVGKVNIGGFRRTRHCTGTLIAPDKVVTAAHCLVVPVTHDTEPLGNIHFLAGARHSQWLAHGRAKCVKFMDGHPAASADPASRVRHDVAIIVTTENLEIQPVEQTRGDPLAAGRQLTYAAYSRDRRHLLAADRTCRLLDVRDGLWFTDCDANFGGSGGPIFVHEHGGLRLGAILVGYVEGEHSVAIPASSWAALAETASCE